MTTKWQRWKNIMKAVPFEESRLLKWKPPFIVQPKYDGIRCRAIPVQTGAKGNEYILVSSEENILYSVPHLNEMFSSLSLRCELDGELYRHGMSFEQITSITSRTVNLHDEHLRIQFHCFDIINNQPQMRRLILIDNLKGLNHWLQISPFWICESLDDVKSVYDKVISLNYEGIIVRNFNNLYETKRSTMLMKFKPKKKDTYKIVGWKEEVSKDGIPKERIGSLILSSQLGDTFGVSAGLNFDDKDRLWKIKDQLSEKQVIVHYQHLTDKGIPKGTFDIEVVDDNFKPTI